MDKISIRAVPHKFDNGSFLLLPATPNDRTVMDLFCKELNPNIYVKVVMEELKSNKSYDQIKTIWALVSILYEITNQCKPTTNQAAAMYMSLIQSYAPTTTDPRNPSNKIYITLSHMNKQQASVFINSIMQECIEKMGNVNNGNLIVDVQDLFTEFIEWRGRQKRDPIDVDEDNGWLLMNEWCKRNNASMATGLSGGDLEIAHIITRKARPDLADCVWNCLRLTHYEHIEIQHRKGWQELLSLYPHLIPRVKAAYDRAKMLYPFTMVEKFQKEESSEQKVFKEEIDIF